MTTRVLDALALRAAMRSVDVADLPGIVARHKVEVDRLDAALTRVEAEASA